MRIYFRASQVSFQSGTILPGLGGQDATQAPQPHEGTGDMRLLFRGGLASLPAQSFPSPGIPAQSGDCGSSARRQMDTLPDRQASSSWSGTNPAGNSRRPQRGKDNARRSHPPGENMLLARPNPGSGGRAAADSRPNCSRRRLLLKSPWEESVSLR